MKTIEEIGNIQWGSTDGRHVLIKDMELGHLVNCINWVKDHPRNYRPTLYEELEEFAKYNTFLLFCEKKPYPLKSDGRWFVYDPSTNKLGVVKPPQEYIDHIKEHYRDTPEFQKYFERGY